MLLLFRANFSDNIMAMCGSAPPQPVAVTVENQPKFLSRASQDPGSILRVSSSANTKDSSNSNSLQKGCVLYLSTAASSLCILLTALDASALGHRGPSLGMNAPLPDSRSLNIAIPIPGAHQWGLAGYNSTPKRTTKHYGNQIRCPEWNFNEYETVVPDLHGKPKAFPRRGSKWEVHNSHYPLRGSAKSSKAWSSGAVKPHDSIDGCFGL